MSFPSAGCRTCKTRRIKCDETQPVCRRCTKSRRVCYGMRDRNDPPIVHFENPYASGQKKRPRGPRSAPKLETPSHPLVDLKTQAIAYYLHYHLRTLKDAPNIVRGTSDDALSIWMAKPDCPILDLSISSMALAVFSRTQHHPPAAIEASTNYNRLLQTAQTALLSLNERTVGACFLAIFFMSRYEDSVHRPRYINAKAPFTTTLQSVSHHDGALAILKIWKDRMGHSRPHTDIIKHTRRSMIKSALMRNISLPEWIKEGAFFGEQGLELEYDCIAVRLVNLRQRLSILLKANQTGKQHISHKFAFLADQLNKEAQNIDKALQIWKNHFPSTWSYHRHTLSNPQPWPTGDFYSPIVYSYSSLAYAAVWNQYYATRMLINCTRLKILRLSELNSDDFVYEQRLECLSHIKDMANDLASTLPFCLERFTIAENSIVLNSSEEIKPYVARPTVWPLTMASSLGDMDVMQKQWLKSQLTRLGRVVGVGVLECAETDQWLEL